MRLKRHALMALAVCFTLSACAGRAPQPVNVVQATDNLMTCDAIRAEVNANSRRISELGSEQGAKSAQNIAAGVGAVLFILPIFLMDFQGSAGIEARALQSRNDYLATMAHQRCTAAPQAMPVSTGMQPIGR